MDLSEHKMVKSWEEFKLNDIILCGNCGMPSKLTLEGMKYLTDEEFMQLSEGERKDLDFAQRAVKRKLRSN